MSKSFERYGRVAARSQRNLVRMSTLVFCYCSNPVLLYLWERWKRSSKAPTEKGGQTEEERKCQHLPVASVKNWGSWHATIEKYRWQPIMKDVTMETEKIMNTMVGINTNSIELCQWYQVIWKFLNIDLCCCLRLQKLLLMFQFICKTFY